MSKKKQNSEINFKKLMYKPLKYFWTNEPFQEKLVVYLKQKKNLNTIFKIYYVLELTISKA